LKLFLQKYFKKLTGVMDCAALVAAESQAVDC
jgi:hypothetical protein